MASFAGQWCWLFCCFFRLPHVFYDSLRLIGSGVMTLFVIREETELFGGLFSLEWGKNEAWFIFLSSLLGFWSTCWTQGFLSLSPFKIGFLSGWISWNDFTGMNFFSPGYVSLLDCLLWFRKLDLVSFDLFRSDSISTPGPLSAIPLLVNAAPMKDWFFL